MKLAVLLPGSNRIKLGHSEIWKGNVKTSNNETRIAFVKLVDERSLAIELVCALIGRELSLPIPQPYLVRVPAQTISTVTQETMAFALEEVNSPPISSTIQDDELMKQSILKWPFLISCAAFDSWIGNSDRIPHNLLYSGKNDFQMIDHGDALPSYLSADAVPNNKLIQYLKEINTTELSKHQVLKNLLEVSQKFHNIDFAQIHRRIVKSNNLISHEIVESLLNILNNRLDSLADIYKTQLDIRQRDFIYDTPKENHKSSKKSGGV